ncbi:hypothetical protein M1M25_gp080 [Tenacibaculum phage Gundel_1]|uniref:Uncharacterized protein n=1 Tax=Tenacibaculum phage Gundel_1 TaxID=2745672 RepID=A0A8E4ZMX5_9CAUD|nr:hypothetical protein M1M25_gp080 [Tenacibaculum phage Gundel_1]QQV91517.1 hypothetical protein Gundel1_80 [Tenacibaculum phage Gundel_1]
MNSNTSNANNCVLIPFGSFTVYRTKKNQELYGETKCLNKPLVGDIVVGFVENDFFTGKYKGGDFDLQSSYDELQSQTNTNI